MYTEEQIIDGCANNDRKMQKELYDKYSPVLYAICLRYARNRDDAKDILQDGFVRIFLNINQFSRQHSFEGWMKRIMINTSITHYKQNSKYYYQQDISEVEQTTVLTEHFDSDEFTREELMNVLQSISDGYRMVFNLYVLEGFKHREIADTLGIDVATSKSQFHRAKKIIQEKLKKLTKEKV